MGTQPVLQGIPYSEEVGADVLKERAAAYAVDPDSDHPIVVRDLRKTFPPMDGNPEKVAVANMSLKIAKGECFGCEIVLASIVIARNHVAFLSVAFSL